MPALTIAELLAGDITIEEVWAGILNRAFAGTGATAATAFSDDVKSTPYVEIEFEETSEVPDRVFDYTVPGSDPARQVRYYPVATGSLVSRICTVRGVDSKLQKVLVGIIRAAASDFAALFNTDELPYHGINLFKPAGKKQYVDPENRLDKTELRHKVHFNIRAEAWPV
jgi:hypothetical protein